ncbi:MAG: 1-deoxy-D-xylulose-5-phosphate synthase [Verrucomicrobiales bacterium]|jgi:1-deoxy-D-xylulose-5-phosphate synthase|nr:1-deoxy-D-xylulose-5-phosphate synthase [Verrucomicrobiales bacterium]MDP4790605.1 1-deoxy-D-xylulose-5-phosphate synthase [Verrucomicrobiales bacterium]MDP5005956.1 1-deoxy-D-xylulose-5-phosphate synthase [Verrucomicrobiales bacterium]
MENYFEFPKIPTEQLPKVDNAVALKQLPMEDLPKLAENIRRTLIRSLAKTGGHLGPNLGVVELSIAMHRVFSTPDDKFVFDVSHQGYVHKMLTGRWDEIHTIRQYEGLNGFLLRTESEHDCYGAGHAGTAVSAALGMASARDLLGKDDHVVAVAGDAAFTCGPTFEALNNIASATKRFILVLNDNEWSIDRNVGAIAKYFHALQTSSTYSHIHDKAAEFVERIAGKSIRTIAKKVESGAKNLLFPNVLFEKFGIHYYGPIDGHDIDLLVKTFDFLKDQDEPVILHIITEKGRGYEPAKANPMKFHGLGPYKTETGETPPGGDLTFSQIYGTHLGKFALKDDKIVAVTAAMPNGTGLVEFQKVVPERYYDVGIAEEHAALFACGQAVQGLKPFLTIYSTFFQRAYDMAVHDIGIQNLPVRLCMDRAGLSGDDGPTHHGLFDIGYMRHIPNWVLMQAKDEDEFVDMLWTMANYEGGPTAIRYPRGSGTGAIPKAEPQILEIGKAEVIADGTDIALIGLGNMFEMAEATRDQLEEMGYSVALINPRWIKPLDSACLEKYAAQCPLVMTFEDHTICNGFGSAVIEHLNDAGLKTQVERIGWPDQFVEHGRPDILREKHGLTVENAVAKALRHLPARKPRALAG